MVGQVFGLEGEGERKMVDPIVFFRVHQNSISPKWRENKSENEVKKFGLKWPRACWQCFFVLFLFFAFIFFATFVSFNFPHPFFFFFRKQF